MFLFTNIFTGTTGITPLSYTTTRSNVFNGTQPTNEGCTPVDGQETVNCGVNSTLMDCVREPDRNFDLSYVKYGFIWNRTSSVNQQVSVVFRFDQQVDIRRVTMFFFNSPDNNIKVPNLMFYWSNDDSTMPSNLISFNPISINRDVQRKRRLNININDDGAIRFQYFRIVMSFYNNSEWIFLTEVLFCGKLNSTILVMHNILLFIGIPAPYHLIHPPVDGYQQVLLSTTSMTTITCSLNDTIPASVQVTWYHNGSVVDIPGITKAGDTTTLPLENILSRPSSDVMGTYRCVFSDSTNGWTLRRSTEVLITST